MRGRAVAFVVAGALASACAAVLGLPDPALDETIVPDAMTGDVSDDRGRVVDDGASGLDGTTTDAAADVSPDTFDAGPPDAPPICNLKILTSASGKMVCGPNNDQDCTGGTPVCCVSSTTPTTCKAFSGTAGCTPPEKFWDCLTSTYCGTTTCCTVRGVLAPSRCGTVNMELSNITEPSAVSVCNSACTQPPGTDTLVALCATTSECQSRAGLSGKQCKALEIEIGGKRYVVSACL